MRELGEVGAVKGRATGCGRRQKGVEGWHKD